MPTFTLCVAGTTFGVTSLFDSTRDYCHAYLTREPPAHILTVTREELPLEQQRLDDEARREGLRLRVFSDPFLERSQLQQKVAAILSRQDILLFHGSALALDGAGYLFTAPCGTGKSTHTRLWRQCFGSRVVMVNDDKPFLHITAQGVTVHGSPWCGKHGLGSNLSVPLAGVCILRRGREDRIRPLTPAQAESFLLSQCEMPKMRPEIPRFASMIHTLCIQIPLWEMDVTPTESAARTAQAAMCALNLSVL